MPDPEDEDPVGSLPSLTTPAGHRLVLQRQYEYLGTVLTKDSNMLPELRACVGKARRAMGQLRRILA
eukprot:9425035-Prorocentrum_lima.AAC.1